MKRTQPRPLDKTLLGMGLVFTLLTALPIFAEATKHPGYEQRTRANYEGIGKWYLGREISHVMGHLGADWLERREREKEEAPSKLIQALGLKGGETVADIGAGSGYFTRRLSKAVGPKGLVVAVDVQQEMLELLAQDIQKRSLTNVKPQLGTIQNPRLKENSVDLILMVDVYHEFSHPYEMTLNMVKSLKPGGRLVFVEYRGEDPNVPIKRLHKMTEAQVKKEALIHDLEWVKTDTRLPRQHIVIFKRKAD